MFNFVSCPKKPIGPQVVVSRTHPGLLKRLFELEVPEIFDGIVEIKSVAREAGYRSKVAVHSDDFDIDPVGACVGARGMRVQNIVNELRGEKIDIIRWSEEPEMYIAASLSPARVLQVYVEPEYRIAQVVVPDNQLSLAIGKEGQNVRLAAKLTGWKIDIKSESQLAEYADNDEDDNDEDDYESPSEENLGAEEMESPEASGVTQHDGALTEALAEQGLLDEAGGQGEDAGDTPGGQDEPLVAEEDTE